GRRLSRDALFGRAQCHDSPVTNGSSTEYSCYEFGRTCPPAHIARDSRVRVVRPNSGSPQRSHVMKRATALLTAMAVILGTAAMIAQARPSFAGKWTLDPASVAPAGGAPGGGRGGGRGGLGQELTITQDATTLTLEYVGGGRNPGPVKLAYALDGSESKNTGMGG